MRYIKTYEDINWKSVKSNINPKNIIFNKFIKKFDKLPGVTSVEKADYHKDYDSFWILDLNIPNSEFEISKSCIYLKFIKKTVFITQCVVIDNLSRNVPYSGYGINMSPYHGGKSILRNRRSILIDKGDYRFINLDNLKNIVNNNITIDYNQIFNGIRQLIDESNRISKKRQKESEEASKKQKEFHDKADEIQDYLQELEDISSTISTGQKFQREISQDRIKVTFNIPGIKVEPTKVSSSSSYRGYNDHTFTDAKLVFNKKLSDVIKILSLARSRIEDEIPNIEISTHFSNDRLIIIFKLANSNQNSEEYYESPFDYY